MSINNGDIEMGVLIRVFIPESGIKTQLVHDDIQSIREWAKKHGSKDHTIHIYSGTRTKTKREVLFLREALHIFSDWKNLIIH